MLVALLSLAVAAPHAILAEGATIRAGAWISAPAITLREPTLVEVVVADPRGWRVTRPSASGCAAALPTYGGVEWWVDAADVVASFEPGGPTEPACPPGEPKGGGGFAETRPELFVRGGATLRWPNGMAAGALRAGETWPVAAQGTLCTDALDTYGGATDVCVDAPSAVWLGKVRWLEEADVRVRRRRTAVPADVACTVVALVSPRGETLRVDLHACERDGRRLPAEQVDPAWLAGVATWRFVLPRTEPGSPSGARVKLGISGG